MPLNKEQFLNQFTRQALDERISLLLEQVHLLMQDIHHGTIYLNRLQKN